MLGIKSIKNWKNLENMKNSGNVEKCLQKITMLSLLLGAIFEINVYSVKLLINLRNNFNEQMYYRFELVNLALM